MKKINALLRESGVELVLLELEKSGYYSPELKAIFVDSRLRESSQKEVILHELCHVLKHKDFSALYNNSFFRGKMEKEANSYMINYLLEESGGMFNYHGMFDKFNIKIGFEQELFSTCPNTYE